METRETTSHLIRNTKVPSTGEESIEVLNPATGEQVGLIPVGTSEDAGTAVAAAREALPGWSRIPPAERAAFVKAAAREALPGWSRIPPAERAAFVKAAARKMRERSEEIARLVTLENGKPLDD